MDVLRFILRLPFILLRLAARSLVYLFTLLGFLLRPFTGRIRWAVPGWVTFAGNQLARLERGVNRYPKTISALLLLAAAVAAGSYYTWHWYQNKPKPVDVAPLVVQDISASVQRPSAVNYNRDDNSAQIVVVTFSRSAAPVTLIGKPVTAGITLTPAMEGEWQWRNDRKLVFTAKKTFPMGKTYTVDMDAKTLLAPQVALTEKQKTFTTPEFYYRGGRAEFYQDPQDPMKKHAIIGLTFNAPADVKNLESRLSMTRDGKPVPYTVTYDDKKLKAWIHSGQLALNDTDSEVLLTVRAGVGAAVPANTTDKDETFRVIVPNRYSLDVTGIDSQLVESDDGKDRRALIVSFSDPVNEKQITKAVRARLLPEKHPDYNSEGIYDDWKSDDISEKVIALSEPVTLTPDDSEQENQAAFSFSYNAPANRWLLVEITGGMSSAGGYYLKTSRYLPVRIPDYPKTLRFMSDGALLSMKGEKQITVAARNFPGLQLDVKRVIPGQLQHIVSFKDKNFTSTDFNRLSDEYFTEHFTYQTALSAANPGDIQYKGIDLSKYLSADPSAKRGIFLLSLRAWDPAKPAEAPEAESYDEGDEDYEEDAVLDSRFVVVTDMGIIAKSSPDGSRDVFVQSVYTGEPVSGAKVSVVAKNGTTLLSRTTGSDGHAAFPPLHDFRNEQMAVMFLAEKEGDVSFLPVNAWYDRQPDFSRFDIYGDETPEDPRTLSSYLFSDRGIYRPGETFHAGLITRTYDWKTPLTGIPLRAEIRDPRDTLMHSQQIILDATGFSELSYTTSENSPTGDWNIYLYLEGKDENDLRLLGTTTVVVKEFEPDSMKVALKLTPDRQQGWVKPEELQAAVDVQNLFGTPSQNRRIATKMTMRPVYPSFTQYPDYRFYENSRSTDNFETQLEERTTDENGAAPLALGLENYAEATYQLQLFTEAFEPGSGRSVTAAARVLVSPHDSLVGIKADGDTDYISKDAVRMLNLIAVDPSLTRIEKTNLKLVLLEQKYISVLMRQPSGVFKYQSRLKETRIDEQPLTISSAGTDITLNTSKPGHFILQAEDADGNVLNRTDYTVAGNANITRSLDRNAELQLTLNKEEYKPGEEIEIAVSAPYTGSGIITIERDKVYQWVWFRADTTNSVQKIRVPAELTGNGYVNVQFVRDINSDEIFMSPLSFGVQPFRVSHEAFNAGITLASPDVMKPGENLAVHVKTTSPQNVVVFAIDEGILQVARYRLKDPLDYFFRKRALEVKSTQILDLILPEFSKMMALTAAPGGDAGEGIDLHLNPFKRKRDEPVAYWSGITAVDGDAVFNYQVPDYFNGKIRVMAVSVSPDRIGHTQSSTTVRDDFVLTPNIPAMVSPGDEFDVSLGIANNLTGLNGEAVPLDVTVSADPALEITGSSHEQITPGEKKETVLSFRLKANALPGTADITFRVTSGDKSAVRTQNLSVRPASAYRTRSSLGRMDGKQQRVTALRQMFDNYAKRDARVSYSPMVMSEALSQYLDNYPYNCSEQITSRAIPLLFSQRNPEISTLQSQTEIRKQLQQTMTTLLTRQNGQGGIGEWQAMPETDPFVTLYVVQFLLEAQDAGYPVQESLLGSANIYLKKVAANPMLNTQDDLRMRAFAVYLLTRQGEVTTGLLAEVQTQMQSSYPDSWQDDPGALYLAASYKMLKMDKQADMMLAPTWKALNTAYNKAWWTRSYLDPLVQDSTRLYLIVRHFPEKVSAIPPQLLENMVLRFKDERYTTYSAAMSILAMEYYSRHMQQSGAQAGELTISVLKGTEAPEVISVMKNASATGKFSDGVSEIRFDNPSDNPAWYVVTESGFDRTPPQAAVAKGLEISRDYLNEKGEVITSAAQGEKVYVRLHIRANAKQGLNNIVVADLLPGGFEVVRQDPEAADSLQLSQLPFSSGRRWVPDFSDAREDRVLIYGSAAADSQEFIYQIKPVNTGRFIIPPAFGEAMYDREIQAQSAAAGVFTVLPPAADKP